MVKTATIRLETRGNNDIVDITPQVTEEIGSSGIKDGIATIFVVGSTAGVTTIEHEGGLLRDLSDLLEELIPSGRNWAHNRAWGDDNGHSHLRASLMGPSLAIPISQGRPTLGTWQQVVLVDFDTRPRRREVILKMIGE